MRFLRLLRRRWIIQCVPEHPGTVRAIRLSLGIMLGIGIIAFGLWSGLLALWIGTHTLKETYLSALQAAQRELKQKNITIQALSGESERLRQENVVLRNEYAELAKRLNALEEQLRDHQQKIDAALHPRAEHTPKEVNDASVTSTGHAARDAMTHVQNRTDLAPVVIPTAFPSSLKTSLKTVQVATLKSKLSSLKGEARAQEEALPAFIQRIEAIQDELERTPSIQPAAGRVTSVFGYRIDPFTHTQRMHEGIDFANRWGTQVVATARGKVIFAGFNGPYGLQVKIQHKPNLVTTYAHLSKIDVKVGQSVEKGERIGRMGSTGRSTGPHLHYEVHVDGQAVDPATYLGGTIHVEEALYQD